MPRRRTFDDRLIPRVADPRATRSCGGKHRFDTKRQALARIKNANSAHPLYWYKCKICRGFHLTKRPPAPKVPPT